MQSKNVMLLIVEDLSCIKIELGNSNSVEPKLSNYDAWNGIYKNVRNGIFRY